MKPTLEELLLQILSTCLLINAQGKWHAFYSIVAHCGYVDVTIDPSDTDYQAATRKVRESRMATFTRTNRHHYYGLTEDTARQELIDLLAWLQGYLSTEVAA